MFPGAITLPSMLTGATDNAQLRARGVQAYGFGPIVDEKDAIGGGGAHGDDERLLETSLYKRWSSSGAVCCRWWPESAAGTGEYNFGRARF